MTNLNCCCYNAFESFLSGNDNIFTVTNIRANSLKFDLVDWEGNVTYATYDSFWIDDEIHNYKAHITGYRGTAGINVKSLILLDICGIFLLI